MNIFGCSESCSGNSFWEINVNRDILIGNVITKDQGYMNIFICIHLRITGKIIKYFPINRLS